MYVSYVCLYASICLSVGLGEQGWFTTVEKIIINWLMVKVSAGGMCVRGSVFRSQCFVQFVVDKMLSCTL